MSSLIEQLSNVFRKFPGIGSRQAKRFVYFLLQQNDSYITELTNLIAQTRKHMRLCTESFQFFYDVDESQNLSVIVRDDSRTKEILMIVLKDMDLENIEKSKMYNGQYFVLGGLAPMIDTQNNHNMRDKELLSIVRKRATQDKLKEIIFALPLNTEGEHTQRFIHSQLDILAKEFNIKISSLGRGLSTGTELEYIDDETFKDALESRK